MGEHRIAFERIMDQLYNHPEEMRARLLAKYDMPQFRKQQQPQTAIEILRNLH